VPQRVPRAGDIWYVDFSPQVGREQAGIRPALVVSNDAFNDVRNDLHIICPLTTRDRGLRYHLHIAPPEGGITKPSLVMCDQVKSQSIERFLQFRGFVSEALLFDAQRIVIEFLNGRHLSR
jgi:mRNA interferase MazF